MNMFIKWLFVVAFLVIAGLFAFGVMQPSVIVSVVTFLCFAYLAYKTDVKITIGK